MTEKEAAAAVELSSYALLRTRATRRNLSHTATEVGKPSVRGERCPVAGSPLPPHVEELAVLTPHLAGRRRNSGRTPNKFGREVNRIHNVCAD